MTDHATASSSPQLSPAGGTRVLRKIDALDGFRGLAVLLIIVHHLPVAVPYLFHRLTKGGGFGVDAFFVLSGFLITAILLREQNSGGRVRFGAFYRRRALRLLPALVVFLIFYVFYEAVTNLPKHHEPSSALSILFYYSNTWLHRTPQSPGLGQMWSLAVEEQFYFLWPLCFALFFGLRRRFSVTVALMVGLDRDRCHPAGNSLEPRDFVALALHAFVHACGRATRRVPDRAVLGARQTSEAGHAGRRLDRARLLRISRAERRG